MNRTWNIFNTAGSLILWFSGTAIKLLYDGDDRSKEAAAGALHKMAQQERYKMAICRVEGGIEVV